MVVSQRKSHMNVNNCWQTVQNWCKRNSIWNGNKKNTQRSAHSVFVYSIICAHCTQTSHINLHILNGRFCHYARLRFLLSRRLRAKILRTMHSEWSMARTNESQTVLKFPENNSASIFYILCRVEYEFFSINSTAIVGCCWCCCCAV